MAWYHKLIFWRPPTPASAASGGPEAPEVMVPLADAVAALRARQEELQALIAAGPATELLGHKLRGRLEEVTSIRAQIEDLEKRDATVPAERAGGT